jgi:autotransporter strand-loop-strand O-heptosyltransferase
MNIAVAHSGSIDAPVQLAVSSPHQADIVELAPSPSDQQSAVSADTPKNPASGSTGASPVPRAYPAAAPVPTQTGPAGLRFDFNDGARVVCPQSDKSWKIRLRDLDTGNILFETEFFAGSVNSTKRYYIRFGIEVTHDGETLIDHQYSARDREVLIQFPVGTLGDPMGWFPYAVKFKEKHGCRLTCAMGAPLISLFRDAYPDIEFVTHEEVDPARYYASYSIGLFFDDKDFVYQPTDFRHVGLHRTAGYILGVDPTEQAPRIVIENDKRPIAEPYVCIAVQSTTQSKYWNNPNGWRELVGFLKQSGYRVICIDQKPTHGTQLIWNHIPNGAEDETGDKPLADRVRLLKHAEFFVGLSSGLSWLAWAAGIPVVMISGFTHPTNEFSTPYRVINYHACNSCWNDPRVRFDHKDFLWCPRHVNTPRQFECTRLITVDQVKQVIAQIPGFPVQARKAAKPIKAKSI